MKQEETQYLVDEKRREGKSYQEIGEELNNFKQSQIQFKSLEKENQRLKKIIQTQVTEIESLKKKSGEDKNKRLIDGLKEHTKAENSSSASLNNIRRIIKFTEAGQSYTKTDLSRDLIIPTTCVEEILNFLNNYTNVKFTVSGGRYSRQ